ncbi:adenosylhomocysteinase [Schaalia sp. 19OD2882]|nr:adenosylhomocysteinase [Schaalia sp. 19OD2882]
MPITVAAVQALATRGLLKGRRIGVSLVLEPKTAVLALLLAEAGAEVFVFGHASETRDDVADVLRGAGVTVFAESTADPAREEALARQFLAQGLHLLLDDGSHLIRMAHDPGRAPGALDHMIGCAEETTSGLRPLRTPGSASVPTDDRGQVGAEEPKGRADGFGQGEPPVRGLRQRTPVRPAIPVMASNDARSKTLFDNAYGTGQSCLMTALDLLDPDHSDRALARSGLVGTRVLVLGYGDVGRGFARLVRGLGGEVDVAEIDPVRLLQARMDGCGTGALGHEGALALAPGAHWIVSATGEPHTVTADLLAAARDGALCFVIGGVDQEIAVDQAVARGATWQTDPRRAVEHLRVPDRAGGPGPLVTILDRGGCLNCTAGEGNPIEIMDLSFAVQVAALEHLLLGEGALAPGIHLLPKEADDAVAAAAISLASASPALAPVTVKLVEKALKDESHGMTDESQQMNDESQTTDDKH